MKRVLNMSIPELPLRGNHSSRIIYPMYRISISHIFDPPSQYLDTDET